MTDWGFKIKTDLAMKTYALCIPPSAAKGSQMTSSDVKNDIKYCKRQNICWASNIMYDGISHFENTTADFIPSDIQYTVRVIVSLVNLKKPLAK